MKTLIFLLPLFLVSPLTGQEKALRIDERSSTQSYLNSFLLINETDASSGLSFAGFLKNLEKKQASIKKEKEFVRYIFSKTHQVYLKQFVVNASFNNLFSNGSYNCLTGTILYTLLLNHFNVKHQVIETNYHIFVLVETAQGKVLLEVTDPYNGFVDSPHEIEVRISKYKENALYAANNKLTYYEFNFNLFNPVSMDELRGLLYYNMAVDAYNSQKLKESVQYLALANKLYSSSRIEEFSQILILAIRQSALDNQLKEEYLKAIFIVQQKTTGAMAMLQQP